MLNPFFWLKKVASFSFLLFFVLSTGAASILPTPTASTSQDFPTVDPLYIYDQLAYLATHFLHREAGYDSNLPANVNGHDEFAAYWSHEMLHNFQNFGAHVKNDPFPVQGWRDRPATVPAFNVEVTIPGASQPDQVVIIGCHYDGEAVSTQSAYDDTSGCAIELGIARGLALYWQSHHLYPARTLRFVLFDAEEQGLYGSFHYVNQTSNGDLQNIVAMFNEEQNGMAFPVRYLGQASHPQMPFSVEMTPLQNTTLTGPLLERNKQFRSQMEKALPEVFAKFRALGFQGLTYHDQQKKDVAQDIFAPQQMQYVHIEDDKLGSSDQVPFTLAGLPCATFAGNASYYDKNAPEGSYPYDQQADTLTLLNTYANGGIGRSAALTLALALPGMFTNWMLHQASVLGEVPTEEILHKGAIFALNARMATLVGQPVTLGVATTFDPADANAHFSYRWDFGDGTMGTGVEVSHSYKEAKRYSVTLEVRSSSGVRQLQTSVDVVVQAVVYQNDYAAYQPTGYPPPNPQIRYPVPNAALSDVVVGPVAVSPTLPAIVQAPTTRQTKELAEISPIQPIVFWLIGFAIVALLVGLALMIGRRKRNKSQG